VVVQLLPKVVSVKPSLYAECGISYEYHTELGLVPVSFTTLRDPASVNLLADQAGNWHGFASAISETDTHDEAEAKIAEYRYNVLFCDGHVKLLGHTAMEGAWRHG
jgi:prepilin-type processing-associated H-X9-DG protein